MFEILTMLLILNNWALTCNELSYSQVQIQNVKASSHIRENLSTQTCVIISAKKNFGLLDLLLYGPVNSYGHVRTLAIERDVKQ